MLPIYICDDDAIQRKRITHIIDDYIALENLDMRIVCATERASDLLDYLADHKKQSVYFLDVELRTRLNGIQLVGHIRDYDPEGYVVFVTSHANYMFSSYDSHTRAFGYIVKDGSAHFGEIVVNTLKDVYADYTKVTDEGDIKKIYFTSKGKKITANIKDICAIESDQHSPHRLQVKELDNEYPVYNTLREVENSLDESFFRCCKSCIINLNQVVELDFKKHIIKLENGCEYPVSRKYYSDLKNILYGEMK